MKFIKSIIKVLIKKLVRTILRFPSLKERMLPVVQRFPTVYSRLKRIHYSTNTSLEANKEIVLSEDGLSLYRDLRIVLDSRSNRSGHKLADYNAHRD